MNKKAKQKGFILHASSVYVSGKALLFLGHSTSGKSTISRLLSKRYPIISDDKTSVWKTKNGGWRVSDGSGEFVGKGTFNDRRLQNKGYPLLAITRIYKAKSIKITPLCPREACRCLVDAIFEVESQRREKNIELNIKWFNSAAEMARTLECWRLTFRNDISILGAVSDLFEHRIKPSFQPISREERQP